MRTYQRRAVLGAGLGLAGSGLLDACARRRMAADAADTAVPLPAASPSPTAPIAYVSPDGPEVLAAERLRGGGPVRSLRITATESTVDLGGPTVRTWTYGDRLPGSAIRVTAGDILEAAVANHLPQATTVHWHGAAIRDDMDGVPQITQRAVPPGGDFTYRFTLQQPGTYWYHPHTGMQQDRGLYGALVVEDPREPLSYDHEWVVVLDDWLDGVDGSTPDAVLRDLTGGMGPMDGTDDGTGPVPGGSAGTASAGTGSPGRVSSAREAPGAAGGGGPSRRLTHGASRLLGGRPGDVDYPYYLINGRAATDPETFTAKPGDRIRLRIINAGGDTAFRVALGGHRMTITHADSHPVAQRTVDALLLGMGERYDVLVTAGTGAFPLVALAEGKDASALAVLRTGPGAAPVPGTRPAELDGLLLTSDRLAAAPSAALAERDPDTRLDLRLSRDPRSYTWGFDGRPYDRSERIPVVAGERVRLTLRNATGMWHPIHLHGHSFALPGGGALKDTAILRPGRRLDVEFDTDNPGLWMLHCHNIYHSESGMMTVLGYRA